MGYAAFLLILLSAVAFFNYHAMLSEQMQKALFYLAVLFGGFVAWTQGGTEKDYPRKALILLMAGIVISIFMSSMYHPQSLSVSVKTTLPGLLAYLTLAIYMRLNLQIDKVIRIYLVLAAVSSVVYFCNVLTLPNNIFGKPLLALDETRGIVRLPVVFGEFFPVLIFYAINRWLKDKKIKWVAIGSALLVMVVLSVVRQVILYTVLLSMFFILKKVSWKIKVALCAAGAAVVIFVLPMIPVYKAMMELSEDQADENEEVENIRITAWRYYTYDNQTGALTPIFGNGTASYGNSIWGIAFDAETEDNGCFAEDVGWAGFYWRYGAVALAGLLWLMISALSRKKAENMQFLNYGLIYYLLLPIASGPNLYYHQIINLTMLLYMAYACPQTDSAAERGIANVLPDIKPRPRLLPRFPQLK